MVFKGLSPMVWTSLAKAKDVEKPSLIPWALQDTGRQCVVYLNLKFTPNISFCSGLGLVLNLSFRRSCKKLPDNSSNEEGGPGREGLRDREKRSTSRRRIEERGREMRGSGGEGQRKRTDIYGAERERGR